MASAFEVKVMAMGGASVSNGLSQINSMRFSFHRDDKEAEQKNAVSLFTYQRKSTIQDISFDNSAQPLFMGFIDVEFIKRNNIKAGFLGGIGSPINSNVAIDDIFKPTLEEKEQEIEKMKKANLITDDYNANFKALENAYNIPTVNHTFKSSLDNVCAFYVGYNFSKKIEGLFGLGISFINIEQKSYFEGKQEEGLICKTKTGIPLNFLIGIKYNFNDKFSFNLISIATSDVALNFESSSATDRPTSPKWTRCTSGLKILYKTSEAFNWHQL